MKRATHIWTLAELAKTPAGKLPENQHLFNQVEGKKEKKEESRNKYGNQKVYTEDGVFDSKREAKRYKQLRMLLKAGEIAFLACQVQFELNAGGSHSLIYIADFHYMDRQTGKYIVEDAKGARTEVYKKKCRLMKEVYGIDIKEI